MKLWFILFFILPFISIELKADELYTWFSGKMKTELLYADPEEFISRAELATRNGRFSFKYKLGQYQPVFTYENDLFGIGIGGLFQYSKEFYDYEGRGINLYRTQIRSGGFFEVRYSKLSFRAPIYYEDNELELDEKDSNYILVSAPTVHYELFPDLFLYAGAKMVLKSSLQKDDYRWQAGFNYTFGRGYFRPDLAFDYTIDEKASENGRVSIRIGSFLGRLDEFITHSFYINMQLGPPDLGQDSYAYEKVFGFNYSVSY